MKHCGKIEYICIYFLIVRNIEDLISWKIFPTERDFMASSKKYPLLHYLWCTIPKKSFNLIMKIIRVFWIANFIFSSTSETEDTSNLFKKCSTLRYIPPYSHCCSPAYNLISRIYIFKNNLHCYSALPVTDRTAINHTRLSFSDFYFTENAFIYAYYEEIVIESVVKKWVVSTPSCR